MACSPNLPSPHAKRIRSFYHVPTSPIFFLEFEKTEAGVAPLRFFDHETNVGGTSGAVQCGLRLLFNLISRPNTVAAMQLIGSWTFSRLLSLA